MMDGLLLLLLFVAAVGIGWWLGRRYQHQLQQPSIADENYYRGLNYLLNHETDAALDLFIDSLEVNNHNLATHLALGNAFRRKGEVDKAIHIHQNLLNREGLTHQQLAQAQLELAHDFVTAGLLDRAEQLLLESAGFSPDKQAWGTLLLDIYQREKDWQKALDIAQRFHLQNVPNLAARLSHYACELAQDAVDVGHFDQAQQYLVQGHKLMADNPRVAMIQATIAMQQQNFDKGGRFLRQLGQQDPSLIPLILSDLAHCYVADSQQQEWQNWLHTCMQDHPCTSVMLALADILRQQSDVDAVAFVTQELRQRPSVRGFNYLIDLYMQWATDHARESLEALQGLTVALEQSKPAYQCKQCGYASNTMQWQCPTCHQWDTTKPVYGLRGE
ncbi:MAG: lipopolysaccharide assembly protein LapB [Gammaproteobacteria bacterium]|jgi:lipopolysaccharide biosynthesis regulator YciM|nr:lipopolysaccharide assembly protein LapB [Gammaproteobacteria bacterium]